MKTILLMGSAALALSAFAADIKTMTKGNAHAYGGYGKYGDFEDAAQMNNDVWVWDDGTRNTPDDLPTGGGRYVVETIGEFAQVGDTFEPTLWLSNSLNRTNVNACRIRPRKMKWTFGDLHLFPGTSVISLGGNGNEIAGTVTLHGTEEHPVTFLPGGGQMNQRVSASLKGDGLVRFLSTEYAYPNNAVTNRPEGQDILRCLAQHPAGFSTQGHQLVGLTVHGCRCGTPQDDAVFQCPYPCVRRPQIKTHIACHEQVTSFPDRIVGKR